MLFKKSVLDDTPYYICMCVRADVLPFIVSQERLDTTDCAEIWCVVTDRPTMHFIHATSGVHLHARTCAPLFHSSGNTGRFVLKFSVLADPLIMRCNKVICKAM